MDMMASVGLISCEQECCVLLQSCPKILAEALFVSFYDICCSACHRRLSCTKHCSQVDCTRASCLGGSRFNRWSSDLLSDLRFYLVFITFSRQFQRVPRIMPRLLYCALLSILYSLNILLFCALYILAIDSIKLTESRINYHNILFINFKKW
jgi:hypothetical protein